MADSQRKTANLFDATIEQGSISVGGDLLSDNRVRTKEFINVESEYITLSWNSEQNTEAYIMMYDANGDYVRGDGWATSPTTRRLLSTIKKIRIIWRYNSQADISPSAITNIMLNTGSTALPYEPYGWVHSLRKLGTSTDTITTLPVDLYADGNNATVGLKGNTVQSGTPTPDNPIMPQGTGERTGNLLNPSDILYNTEFNTGSNPPAFVYSDTLNCSNYIPVTAGTYLRILNNVAVGNWFYEFDANKNYLRTKAPGAGAPMEISVDASYIAFNISNTTDINNYMFARTSTPIPYEPYGYKIPISNGQQTTNIYLGSTQTTRKITKYTFTGNETTFSCVATTDGQNYCVVYRFIDFGMTDIKDFDKIMRDIDYPIFISSHFKEKTNTNSDFNDIKPNEVGANTVSAAGNRYIIFCVSGLTTAAEYSAWFAQQYANGTPVEVYYILETATTSIVNEPLMKIGDYADSLSNATSIPTIEGANSITVDTTVQPSEFTATWTGWHNASVKEKSENLWDEDYTNISSDIYYKPVYVGDYEIVTVSSTVPLTSQNFANLFALGGQQSSGASTGDNGVYSGRSMSVRPVDGYITIAYRNANGVNPQDYDTMVNEGRTALPYEPYWK